MIDAREWSPRTQAVFKLLSGNHRGFTFKEIAEHLEIKYWHETVDRIKVIIFPLVVCGIADVWRAPGRGRPYMVRYKDV